MDEPSHVPLQVIPPGALVSIPGEGSPIDARVLAVIIDPGPQVSYRVAWWNGRTLEQETLHSQFVARTAPARLPIGFFQNDLGPR